MVVDIGAINKDKEIRKAQERDQKREGIVPVLVVLRLSPGNRLQ